MKIDMEYVKEFLIKLLKTPSPTGDTAKAVSLVKDEMKSFGLKITENAKGGFYATMEGELDDYEVLLSAHVDTLGAMVKELKSNGRLKLSQLGGYSWTAIEGCEVIIATMGAVEYTGTVLTTVASSHVHGGKTENEKRDENLIEVRVDERVENEKDLEALGINVGDFVYLKTGAHITDSGFVKSRHLDDKACVAVLLGVIKALISENKKPKRTTHFFISNYEEVGHGSSAGLPEKVRDFISLDMAAPGEGQTSSEYKVTICAKDSSGPYDKHIKEKFVDLAMKNDIPYAIDIYPHYGSDASAALRAGWNIRTGLIGPGVDASHSFERTHIDAIEATIDLTLAYLMEE